MDNKYYTPTIEDFHVGFEYEIFEDFDILPEKIWHKQVYGEDGNDPESMDFVLMGYMDKFRVKYLDREDIESMGWYFKSKTDGGLDYLWSNNHIHSIIFDPITKRCVITIRDEDRKEDYTAFVGTIKNKSELKKIMQQTNIL